MAINLRNTSDIKTDGVKILVYGQAGAGKTRLISTLPNPIILSAESGLLSLSGYSIPFIEISNISDLEDAYTWVMQSNEAKNFDSIAIDSLSEIGEVVLSSEKSKSKDPRQAYGELQDVMSEMIRNFRDIKSKNVYFSSKLEKSKDAMDRIYYGPSMPGNKLSQQLPYFFDEVFAMRKEKAQDGSFVHALMCHDDGFWMAKDRSGKLDTWEMPDLGLIINKIG